MQVLVTKQAECDRLAQHASNDINDDAVPLLVDDATAEEIVKLKGEISAKNALSKSMQAKLGAALQEVEETKKVLAIAEQKRDMISKQMESAMMELSATNEAVIWVKANSAPVSTFQTNFSNRIFNFKMSGVPTYHRMRTLDAVTSFISTLHRHFGPHPQVLGLTDDGGIPLTDGWAAVALLLLCDKAWVWDNHRFPAHGSAGVAWEHFSAGVRETVIPPNAVTWSIWDWERLQINSGKCVSTFNEHVWELRHQLEPHAPLSDECLRDSYQLTLDSNPEVSKALIDKLGSQPTASLNDGLENVSRVDARLNSNMQSTQVTFNRMEVTYREGGGWEINNWCCYAYGEVVHPTHTCPNKEKVMAAWQAKKAATKEATEMKEKANKEGCRGSHGSHKKEGYTGGGGGKQQSIRLAQTLGGENDNAKVPELHELSDSASDDDDDSGDSGSGNGDWSDSLSIDSLELQLLLSL